MFSPTFTDRLAFTFNSPIFTRPNAQRPTPNAFPMTRREFLHLLAVASAGGFALDSRRALAGEGDAAYDLPPFGRVRLLHITDTHAQLLPTHYREPHANLGTGAARGRPPHLTGEALLRAFGIAPSSRDAHAFTHLDSTVNLERSPRST